MTDQRPAPHGWFARWREHRRAERQQAIEREYHDPERLSSTTRAYTDADNRARRTSSYLGGGGGMREPGRPASTAHASTGQKMNHTDAQTLATRLQAEQVDGASQRFFARRMSDGSWSVAKMLIPEHLRSAQLQITAEHQPPPAFADDTRTGHETRVPGLPGGLG